MELPPIAVILLLLVFAFGFVMLLNILRWPTIPAYFVAGLVVGPNGINVLREVDDAHFIAELGIIFLLFTIGLKISLSALKTMRNHVVALGGMQTVVTGLVFALPVWWWSGNPLVGLLVGSVAAMSSTAIVSQLLIKENILNSPVGNRAMGVLLFQDLAVIPLIIIFSSKSDDSLVIIISLVLVKVVLIMALILFVGGKWMERWLDRVSRYGDNELYILNLVMLIAVLSGLTAFAGLSYALGAFLAGILMSETLHRYRVMRIVEPFRHIFLGFFFMSLGMLVDLQYLAAEWFSVIATSAAFIVIKAPLVYGCVRLLGSHRKTAIWATILLAGTGEFGFVLITLARGDGIVSEEIFQLLLSANLLSLMVVPFVWKKREMIGRALWADDWATSARRTTENLSKTLKLRGHVIICGFGRTGQAIAGILRELSVPYVALDENYVIFRSVGGADNVIYAECGSADGLMGAGIARAKTLIVSFIDPVESHNVIEKARELNPNLVIIAKADTAKLASELKQLGADHVFIDAHETGFSIVKQSLIETSQARREDIKKTISRARTKENPYFTGEFIGGDSKVSEDISFIGCVVKKPLPSLAAVLPGCRVISWLRRGEHLDTGNLSQPLKVGDELVLSGDLKDLLEIKEALEDTEI